MEHDGVDQINVRSPITCETRYGVCSTCYGRDLARGRSIAIASCRRHRRAVHRRAGTQLTMRTFHIGGAARVPAASSVEVRNRGVLRFITSRPYSMRRAIWSRSRVPARLRGRYFGRERERYKIPYGAVISVKEATRWSAGRWWPPGIAHPSGGHGSRGIPEVPGLRRRLTITTQVDEVTASPALWCSISSSARQGPASDHETRERQGQGSHLREHGDSGGVYAASRRIRQFDGRVKVSVAM